MLHSLTPLVRLALATVLWTASTPFTQAETACTIPSSLNCDYWLATPESKAGRAWARELAVRAGENGAILGELRSGAFLVRAADDAYPRLSQMPGLASLEEVDGATKATFEATSLLESHHLDDWLVLSARLYPGEDTTSVGQALRRALPAGDVAIDMTETRHARSTAESGKLFVRTKAKSLDATLELLTQAEAISEVTTWQAPELQSQPAVPWHQTGHPTTPNTDRISPAHSYDSTAKLFANGIFGVGQVIGILDRGFENTDGCQFRYGPNADDQRAPFQNIAADATPTLNLERKVIASVRPLAMESSCDYDGSYYTLNGVMTVMDRPIHGTNSASVAAGDDYWVLAGMSGTDLDNPFDIESTRVLSSGAIFENAIDHHDLADGMAPGAQLFFQDVLPERMQFEDWEEPPELTDESDLPCQYDYSDVLAQAYSAHEQLRTHNNSWGTTISHTPDPSPHYHVNCATFDRASWQYRDMTFTRSAGNGNDLLREAHEKSTLVVGSSAFPLFGFGMASATASGPGLHHRIKPDLVGQLPLGRDGWSCPPTGSEQHTGTSTSSPVIAGLAALVREYFVEGYLSGGSRGSSPGFSPTNALIRAVLLNSTRGLQGGGTGDTSGSVGHRPSLRQGWGAPAVDDTLFFAGDLAYTGGQRANLLVLNDVPNGVRTLTLKDGRHKLLDQYHPAIGEGEIHEYKVHVDNSHQFHVTLSWSDPPPVLAPGADRTTYDPLRNDLDLEIISPDGVVFRPNPGSSSADPNRLWQGGYSIPGTALCPTSCCRGTAREAQTPQFSGPYFCDFAGRDRWNTTENIFIDFDTTPISRGTWTIRVIGYDFLLGMADPDPRLYPAWPDLVVGDEGCWEDELGNSIEEPHDCIQEDRQGYALVVSGDVSSANPYPRFRSGFYSCGDQASIEVRDADRVANTLDVLVQSLDPTEACRDASGTPVPARVVTLTRVPFLDGTPSTLYRSDPADLELQDCTQSVFGAYPVQDDSTLLVSYRDEAGQWRSGTTRASCRDVKLDSAVSSAIVPGSFASLTLKLDDIGALPVGMLAGAIHPMLTDGGFPSTIPVTFTNFGGTHFGVVSLSIPSGFDCATHPELRFRTELWEVDATGTPIDGFRDRAWFGVDCAP
ncbi:MAG: S8 family serine peptidase [Acidobacteriota bacterium]